MRWGAGQWDGRRLSLVHLALAGADGALCPQAGAHGDRAKPQPSGDRCFGFPASRMNQVRTETSGARCYCHTLDVTTSSISTSLTLLAKL